MLPGGARRETGPDLMSLTREAVRAAEGVLQDATRAVRSRVAKDDQTMDRLLDREQRATHALAWLATYVEAVRQLCAYAERMREAGRLGELEQLIVEIGLGEYLAQILGGIPMSQDEIARAADIGLSAAAAARGLGRALSQRRHGRAKDRMVAEAGARSRAADRGVSRADYRLRSGYASDAGGSRGRDLQGLRQHDLHRPSGARRSDDIAGAHESAGERPSRTVDAARAKATRHR